MLRICFLYHICLGLGIFGCGFGFHNVSFVFKLYDIRYEMVKWVGKWPCCRGIGVPFHRGTFNGGRYSIFF